MQTNAAWELESTSAHEASPQGHPCGCYLLTRGNLSFLTVKLDTNSSYRNSGSYICQTRIIQLSNAFDGLYSREDSPWVTGTEYLTSSGPSFPSIRGGKAETAQDWLGSWGFPYKASRPYFLEKGQRAKAELEDRDWCVLGPLTGVSRKCS